MKVIVIQRKRKTYKKGDSIKFSSGAFTDLIAKVESVEEKNRIWILLEVMGEDTED